MAKDIEIKKLKSLGFTEEDLIEIENLSKEFDEGDFYRKIGKKNKELLGTDIQPVKLTFENILKRVENGDVVSPKTIIGEYKQDKFLLSKGSTSDIDSYLNSMSDELASYGIFASPEDLYNIYNNSLDDFAELEGIIYWFRQYKERIDAGDVWTIEQALYLIEEAETIIGMYQGMNNEGE